MRARDCKKILFEVSVCGWKEFANFDNETLLRASLLWGANSWMITFIGFAQIGRITP